jgi:hypothetical protein
MIWHGGDDDSRLAAWHETKDQSAQWMEEPKSIAVGGYKAVLEDGPEIGTSES